MQLLLLYERMGEIFEGILNIIKSGFIVLFDEIKRVFEKKPKDHNHHH